MTEPKKRLFDEEKLIDFIMEYDRSQSPQSAEKSREEIKDFIDSEIKRNVREFAEKVRPNNLRISTNENLETYFKEKFRNNIDSALKEMED